MTKTTKFYTNYNDLGCKTDTKKFKNTFCAICEMRKLLGPFQTLICLTFTLTFQTTPHLLKLSFWQGVSRKISAEKLKKTITFNKILVNMAR